MILLGRGPPREGERVEGRRESERVKGERGRLVGGRGRLSERVRVMCSRYIYYEPVTRPRWAVCALYLPRRAL